MPRPSGVWEPIAQRLVDAIHFEDAESVARAAKLLRYDEQIDAAVRSGILDIAFVAAHSDQGHIESNQQLALDDAWRRSGPFSQSYEEGKLVIRALPRPVAPPPFTFSLPRDRIVVLPHASLPKARLEPGGIMGDKYTRDYCDAALEDELLEQHFKLVNTICSDAEVAKLFEAPYLLDIDLDYFNTRRSIAPKHSSVFYELVRHSAAITIARESACVVSCRLKGETKVISDFLEERLMDHIGAALTPRAKSP
jgi:hypothetical protein